MDDSTVHVLHQNKKAKEQFYGPHRELKLIEKVNFMNRFYPQFTAGLTLRFTLLVSFSLIFHSWVLYILHVMVLHQKRHLCMNRSTLYPNSHNYSSSGCTKAVRQITFEAFGDIRQLIGFIQKQISQLSASYPTGFPFRWSIGFYLDRVSSLSVHLSLRCLK